MGQCQQGKVTARKEKTKQKPQELMYSFFFFFLHIKLQVALDHLLLNMILHRFC